MAREHREKYQDEEGEWQMNIYPFTQEEEDKADQHHAGILEEIANRPSPPPTNEELDARLKILEGKLLL